MAEVKTNAEARLTNLNQRTPRVSIAMPVYNCAQTLNEAIKSIVEQTYTNWELIICDDGSVDKTGEIIEFWARNDCRIRPISNIQNLGLNRSLNRCLEIARGEFYARMDGDDTCSTTRLEKLVAKLDEDPSLALVSSWMTTFDESGTWGKVRSKPLPTPSDFLNGSPFCHAPCMMRTSILRSLGGYGTDPSLRRCEDLDLWFRLYAAGYHGMNIQEALYGMRDDRKARIRRTFVSRLNEARVLWRGFGLLRLPYLQRLRALRPILISLLPGPLYTYLHRRKLSS